jgi:hypothetical protein
MVRCCPGSRSTASSSWARRNRRRRSPSPGSKPAPSGARPAGRDDSPGHLSELEEPPTVSTAQRRRLPRPSGRRGPTQEEHDRDEEHDRARRGRLEGTPLFQPGQRPARRRARVGGVGPANSRACGGGCGRASFLSGAYLGRRPRRASAGRAGRRPSEPGVRRGWKGPIPLVESAPLQGDPSSPGRVSGRQRASGDQDRPHGSPPAASLCAVPPVQGPRTRGRATARTGPRARPAGPSHRK